MAGKKMSLLGFLAAIFCHLGREELQPFCTTFWNDEANPPERARLGRSNVPPPRGNENFLGPQLRQPNNSKYGAPFRFSPFGFRIFQRRFSIAPTPGTFYSSPMRWMKYLVALGLLAALTAQAESARIVKVLPCFLDDKGRHALRPSLYERDAYQALLRRDPTLRKALRFDVQWKGTGPKDMTLRVEARGNQRGQLQQISLETKTKKGFFGNWNSVTLEGDAFTKFGELTAWRATLWNGSQQVAEQKSFLW
jgi:hypothetical protein